MLGGLRGCGERRWGGAKVHSGTGFIPAGCGALCVGGGGAVSMTHREPGLTYSVKTPWLWCAEQLWHKRGRAREEAAMTNGRAWTREVVLGGIHCKGEANRVC